MRARRVVAAAAGGTALALALAGCGFGGVQDIPLPGGADLGSHPYTVKAAFADVVSLIPQSAVKVNGKVRRPANAYAHLEQSSLLGEKYVQLSPPPAGRPATGRLTSGAVIPLDRTNRNPEVEEVFGALSMLLNGGGIQQLKTISSELNKALTGNEPQIRDMLTQVDTLVGTLDTHKKDITDALDGVNQLAATLATRDQKIGTVLTGLSPGLKVLDRQRGSLVTMLQSLDTLSGVAVDTVDRSKDDMVADLRALAPTLQRLADAGKDLPDSLQVLLTYPFTDQVLSGVKGDYLNLYIDLTAAPGTQIVPALQPDDSTYPDVGPTSSPQRAHGGPPLPLPSVTTTRSH